MKRTCFYLFFLLVVSALANKISAQLAGGPWPMFRHDLSHTGRSDNAGPGGPLLAWSFLTGDSIISSPALGPDGQVYVGSGYWSVASDTRVYALTSSGSIIWSYVAGDSVFSSPAVDTDGRVFVGTGSNTALETRLLAFTSGGSLSWSYDTEEAVDSSAAISSDGYIYFGAGTRLLPNSANFYRLTSEGAFSWSYLTAEGTGASPAIASDGSIYTGDSDDNIFAFDSAGGLSWSYKTGHWVISSPAIGSDGRIYVGSFDNRFYCVDAAGSLSWSYVTTDDVLSSPGIGTDGRVYVGAGYGIAQDKRLYVFSADGSIVWSYETGDSMPASPVIGSDGVIYIGSGSDDNADTKIYAFTASGSLLWSYETGAGIGSSAAIGSEGDLYFSSLDNRIYCLKDPTATPTETAVPTATPTPFYVELRVRPNGSGGYDFNPGDQLVLEWETFQDSYSYANIPCAVYLGAAKSPPAEDTPVTVPQIVGSGALFLFNSKKQASRYNPGAVQPTYNGVVFPHPVLGSSGTLSFTVPGGAAGRWVFATAFIKKDGSGYPVPPPQVEVSNGFTLN